MIARPALCCRCGRLPRTDGTYLCARCLADPKAKAEAVRIAREAEGYIAQRRVAIERYAWAGGWGRDR